jgi:hypothetical protein
MRTRFVTTALIALLSQSAFADDTYLASIGNTVDKRIDEQKVNAAYREDIQASFSNMLNHEPYAGPTGVTVELGIKDPVEELLSAIVLTEVPTAVTRSTDLYYENITSSFSRMLDHEPYSGPTGVTVAHQFDYRFDRLVFEKRLDTAAVRLAAIEN